MLICVGKNDVVSPNALHNKPTFSLGIYVTQLGAPDISAAKLPLKHALMTYPSVLHSSLQIKCPAHVSRHIESMDTSENFVLLAAKKDTAAPAMQGTTTINPMRPDL